MRAFKSQGLNPFRASGRVSIPKSVGGSQPKVQQTAEALVNEAAPMLATRIYAPGAMKHYDDSDPRFMGKSDAVENIYQPAQEAPPPRSGLLQIFNWLTTGVMG